MYKRQVKKQETKMRKEIPTATKLGITVRYLATGDSYKSLEYLFRVPESTVSVFRPLASRQLTEFESCM